MVRDAARARVTAAEANVERARRRLDEAHIGVNFAGLSAPFDAVVIDRYVEPGDTATVPSVASTTRRACASRSLCASRSPFASARGTRSRSNSPLWNARVPGVVEEIVPQAEPGSRTLLVKVALDGVEGLYPGLFGRLRLESGRRKSIHVSETAMKAVGQPRFVVLEGGVRRLVTLGQAADGLVEVLSGLTPGDRIRVPAAGH